MALEVKVRGLEEMRARLRSLAKKYPGLAIKGLSREGEFIMTDSKANYCPVKDGHMRASGHVVTEENRVTLGYGGPAGIGNQGESNTKDVGYAVVQHEMESFEHTVGEDKFLEKPLMKALPTIAPNVAEFVKGGIKG